MNKRSLIPIVIFCYILGLCLGVAIDIRIGFDIQPIIWMLSIVITSINLIIFIKSQMTMFLLFSSLCMGIFTMLTMLLKIVSGA